MFSQSTEETTRAGTVLNEQGAICCPYDKIRIVRCHHMADDLGEGCAIRGITNREVKLRLQQVINLHPTPVSDLLEILDTERTWLLPTLKFRTMSSQTVDLFNYTCRNGNLTVVVRAINTDVNIEYMPLITVYHLYRVELLNYIYNVIFKDVVIGYNSVCCSHDAKGNYSHPLMLAAQRWLLHPFVRDFIDNPAFNSTSRTIYIHVPWEVAVLQFPNQKLSPEIMKGLRDGLNWKRMLLKTPRHYKTFVNAWKMAESDDFFSAIDTFWLYVRPLFTRRYGFPQARFFPRSGGALDYFSPHRKPVCLNYDDECFVPVRIRRMVLNALFQMTIQGFHEDGFIFRLYDRAAICFLKVMIASVCAKYGVDSWANQSYHTRLTLCAKCYQTWMDTRDIPYHAPPRMGRPADMPCPTQGQIKEFKAQINCIYNATIFWYYQIFPKCTIPPESLLWLTTSPQHFSSVMGPVYAFSISNSILLADEVLTGGIFKAADDISEATQSIVEVTSSIMDTNVVNKVANTTDAIMNTGLINNLNDTVKKVGDFFSGPKAQVAREFVPLVNDFSLDALLATFNNTGRHLIEQLLSVICPGMDASEYLSTISINRILMNLYLMRQVKNKFTQMLLCGEIVNELKLVPQLTKFFKGVMDFHETDLTPVDAEPQPGTSSGHVPNLNTSGIGDVSTFFWEFITDARTLFTRGASLVAGFVGMLLPGKHWVGPLRTFLNKSASTFRDVTSVVAGTVALKKAMDFIRHCFNLAKEFSNNHFGTNFSTSVSYRIKDKAVNLCVAIEMLSTPEVRTSLMNEAKTLREVERLIVVTQDILTGLTEAKNPALLQTMLRAQYKLIALRAEASWAQQAGTPNYIPLVIHLNGPVNIGKSVLALKIKDYLCTILGINPNVYTFNEMIKYMDGYNGQECCIVDDVNLLKEPEAAAWLIKIVGPNRCILPVAENERRPMVSNIKLLILTSNTPYSVSTGTATNDGIDRRSEFKFEVSVKSGYYSNHKLDTRKCEAVNWDIHQFKRISSVKDGALGQNDEFQGSLKSFYQYIAQRAAIHDYQQKMRIRDGQVHTYDAATRSRIMDMIYHSLDMPTSSVNIAPDPSWRHKLSNIISGLSDTLTSDSDFDTWLASMSPEFQSNYLIAQERLRFNPPSTARNALDRDIAWLRHISRLSEQFPHLDPMPAQRFPRWCEEGYLTFDGPYVDTSDDVNFVQTEPDEFRGFDRCFLHTLNYHDGRFIVDKVAVKEDDKYVIKLMTYARSSTCLCNGTWRDSALRFAVLSNADKVKTYVYWLKHLEFEARTRFHQDRWRRIFDNIINFAKQATSVLIDVTLVATGILLVSTTSLLVYLTYKAFEVENSTSNVPAPTVRGAKGLHVERATSEVDGVYARIIKSTYQARFPQSPGSPTFQFVLLHERFGIIPYHVFKEIRSQDPVQYISLWCFVRKQYIKYPIELSNSARVGNTDAVIIYVPDIVASRSLVKYIPERPITSVASGDPVSVHYVLDETINSLHGTFSSITSTVQSITSTGNRYTFKNMYCCVFCAPNGASGGPVLLDRKHPHRFIGLQSSTGWTYSHAAPLIQSEVLAAISQVRSTLDALDAMELPDTDVELLPEETACCKFSPDIHLGHTEQRVVTSPRTEIRRSPLYGILGTPSAVPVFQLYRGDKRYKAMMEKTELTNLSPYEQPLLDEVVTEYADYWRVKIYQHYQILPNFVESVDDAINGNYPGGKPMDLSTSPGIGVGDWIRTKDPRRPGHTTWISMDSKGHRTATDGLKEICRGLLERYADRKSVV